MTSPADLRIAIWVDKARLSGVDRDLVVWARSEPGLDLVALLVPPTPAAVEQPATLMSALAFRGLVAIETKLLQRRSRRYKERGAVDAHDLLARSPASIVSATDTPRIDALDLDLVVFLGAQVPRDGFAHAARFGTIAFESADPIHRRGMPIGFWEVFERRDTTRFVLKRFARGSTTGEDLLRGHVSTQHFFRLNEAGVQAKSCHYLRSLISRIASSRQIAPPLAALPGFQKPSDFPSTRQTAAYLARFLSAMIGHKLRRLIRREEVWRVAFVRSGWRGAALWQATAIDSPPGHYLADPFVVHRNGLDYCFVEDFDSGRQRGSIGVYELGVAKSRRLGIAIDEPFHLSFPYLFEYGDGLFMCPESASNDDIRIYRCVDFPLAWKLEKVVMPEVSAVDTMIFHRGGKWWLFTVMDPGRTGELASELFVFSAASPFADSWTPHAMNPVIFDAGCARNGGLLVDGEKLYRVSQRRGFARYGKNSQINEIVELTDRTYEERCVETIEPRFRDGLLGTHHMHGIDGITVFDFLVESSRTSPSSRTSFGKALRRWPRSLRRLGGSPAWQESRRPLPTQAGDL